MKTVKAFFPLLVAATLLAGLDVTRGAAEVPGHERVLVTDPAVLESMGFVPTARNVYVWAHARTVDRADPRSPELEGSRYFGPSSSGFSPVFARAFRGRFSSFGYGSFTGQDDIFNTNPATDNFADAQFDTIPDGASLEFFRVWMSDTHAGQNLTIFLLESCLPLFGPDEPAITTLATLSSSGSGGNTSFTAGLGITATTSTCVYYARARFGNASLVGPGDETLRLYRARLQWARQLSPPPPAATFQDVPMTHPFFPFVEALVSTGITLGCSTSPPLYCVNDAVTRGEMAVFLGRALGLDFGF
jgi:hypothetical protein